MNIYKFLLELLFSFCLTKNLTCEMDTIVGQMWNMILPLYSALLALLQLHFKTLFQNCVSSYVFVEAIKKFRYENRMKYSNLVNAYNFIVLNLIDTYNIHQVKSDPIQKFFSFSHVRAKLAFKMPKISIKWKVCDYRQQLHKMTFYLNCLLAR